MNRLTKRNEKGIAYMAIADTLTKRNQEIESSKPVLEALFAMFQKLAHYEDLEEQGLLHIAPVKDGTEIFVHFRDFVDIDSDDIGVEDNILETTYMYGLTEFEHGELNKDWFLTKEEAEKALEGMK